MRKDLITKQTAAEIAQLCAEAEEMIEQGFNLVMQAQQTLNLAVGAQVNYAYTNLFDFLKTGNAADPDSVKQAREKVHTFILGVGWQRVFELMNIASQVDAKHLEKLNDTLSYYRNGGKFNNYNNYGKKAETLPELTIDNILMYFDSLLQNAPDLRRAAVLEAANIMLPPKTDYKRKKFEIKGSTILHHAISMSYSRRAETWGGKRDLLIVDKAFHLLDGKTLPADSYWSPLESAINQGLTGETDYFRFKCYQNNNVHLYFKRPDLVEQLNQIANENIGQGLPPSR